MSSSGSVLFQPFRSLGLVSSHSRGHLKSLGQERFLTAALGKSWAVYNLDKLRVALMGGAREHTIRSIASVRDLTFTTCGTEIVVWRRQEEVYRIRHHLANVYLLYIFGTTLISVDENQLLAVWDTKSLNPATSVKSQMARAVAGASSSSAAVEYIGQDGSKMGTEWEATPIATIQFPGTSRISSLLHPSTYLNKIVVGFGGGSSSGAGGLELWNIKTRSLVYRFKTDAWTSDKHNPDALLDATLGRSKRPLDGVPAAAEVVAVTCLEQSPAVDVIAIGLHSGLVLLLNLQLDTILHVYVHATPGSERGAPIASVSFRTDNNQAQLASAAANSGSVCIWDLEKKQLRTMIKHAHGSDVQAVDGLGASRGAALSVESSSATIHTMCFLPNEPLLLTVATDNALKLWIFDSPDGTARLLKERSGHSAPPSKIRFYPGERGTLDLLSCGSDRTLRAFSLQKEEQSRAFSQGAVEKRSKSFGEAGGMKLPPVVDFAACTSREKEWPNILTAHANDAAGYTWKWSARALTQHKLLNTQAGVMASGVKAVALSACGNFGLLGHASGRVDSFHMQSGTFKGTYGSNHIPMSAAQTNAAPVDLQSKNINIKRREAREAKLNGPKAAAAPVVPLNQGHLAAITGLAVDGLNKQLVSGSLDGFVIFWDFRRRTVLARVNLGSPISKVAYSKENDLVAVMTDDLTLHVLDAVTHTTVRRFAQHTAPLTDLLFSPDAKWIVTASTDCCVRIFDLPSSTMVDFLRFSKPVSSIAMSPSGDFLATTHVGNLAIFLWANKDYFGTSTLGAQIGHEAKQRAVTRGQPVLMDVRERQDGMEDDVDVKQESEDEDEETDDSDSEDEEDEQFVGVASSKRRRMGASGSAQLSSLHTPVLRISEEDQFALITYSSVPKSKWQTLAHLDEIKARNKAKEAVQAPKDAPFFLTALASLSNEKDGASVREKEALAAAFGVPATKETQQPALGARAVKSLGATNQSSLLQLIETAKVSLPKMVAAEPNQNPKAYLVRAYAPVTLYLQSLSPAGIDGELGALGLDPSSEETELGLVLEYFLALVTSEKHFEFAQALLNRFVKTHGSALATHPHLLATCAQLNTVQQRTWGRLEQAFHANLALVSHLAQIQV